MNRHSSGPPAVCAAFSLLVFAACEGSNLIPAPDPTPQLAVSLGADRDESARSTITISGSVTNEQGAVLYEWSQLNGPSVTFSDPAVAQPTITLPHVARGTTAEVEISLSVRDERNTAVSDSIKVTIEPVDRLVFRSEFRIDNVQELAIYDPSTRKMTALNGAPSGTRDVLRWTWQRDESAIAFVDRVNSTNNLHIVKPDGSGLVGVTSATTGSGVVDETWLPDGSRLIFRGDLDTAGVVELYSCLPDGTGLTKLNDTMPTGGDVERFEIAADSGRVFFSGDAVTDGVVELFSVQPDGAGRTKISQTLVAGGDVLDWAIAETTGRIAYRADAETDTVNEAYGVDPDGSNHTKLNGTLVSGGAVTQMAWAPDGSRLAYRADQVTDGVFELFSTLPDGTSGTKLNDTLASGADVASFEWSPNSAFVSYLADQETAGTIELYAVKPDGTDRAKLNGTMVSGGDVNSVHWSLDSGRVAYVADQEVDGRLELFAANPDGTAQAKLSGTMVSGGNILNASVTWAPDNSRILFLADRERAGVRQVYTATPDGVTLSKLTRASFGSATVARWAPDSSGVAYLAVERSGLIEVFYNKPDGSDWRLLNPGHGHTIARADGFRWSPDSKTIAFSGSFTTYNSSDVYTVGLGEADSVVRITASPYSATTFELRWAVDGTND